MGATLANGGENHLTGERAVRSEYVKDMLSVMMTCGMYDYAGGWVYWVGMPAKSGVGGGILAVLPGQLGIAVFSPPLHERGNSVRGVAVGRDRSRELKLHYLCATRCARSESGGAPRPTSCARSATAPRSTSCTAISPSAGWSPRCGGSSKPAPTATT